MRGGTNSATTTVLVLAIDMKDARETVPPSYLDGPCPWQYVVVTPLSLNRARGVVAQEVIVTRTMHDSPELYPLVTAISPCFVSTGGVDAALERAGVTL
jgi:hypothetical protein